MRRLSRDEHGVTSVEMLLLLPLLLLLLWSALELGRVLTVSAALSQGVWRATRYLSVHDPWDEAQAAAVVTQAVTANVLGGSATPITVWVSDAGTRQFGARITVTAETTLTPLLPFLTTKPVTLHAEHTQMVEVYP